MSSGTTAASVDKMPTSQIEPELIYCPLYSQGLFFYSHVVSEGWVFTHKEDGMFLSLERLEKHNGQAQVSAVSACMMKGLSKSGFLSTGELVRTCFRACSVCSASVPSLWWPGCGPVRWHEWAPLCWLLQVLFYQAHMVLDGIGALPSGSSCVHPPPTAASS